MASKGKGKVSIPPNSMNPTRSTGGTPSTGGSTPPLPPGQKRKRKRKPGEEWTLEQMIKAQMPKAGDANDPGIERLKATDTFKNCQKAFLEGRSDRNKYNLKFDFERLRILYDRRWLLRFQDSTWAGFANGMGQVAHPNFVYAELKKLLLYLPQSSDTAAGLHHGSQHSFPSDWTAVDMILAKTATKDDPMNQRLVMLRTSLQFRKVSGFSDTNITFDKLRRLLQGGHMGYWEREQPTFETFRHRLREKRSTGEYADLYKKLSAMKPPVILKYPREGDMAKYLRGNRM